MKMNLFPWLKKFVDYLLSQIPFELPKEVLSRNKFEFHIGPKKQSYNFTDEQIRMLIERKGTVDISEIIDILLQKVPELNVNVFDKQKTEDIPWITAEEIPWDKEDVLLSVATGVITTISTSGELDLSGEAKPKVKEDKKGSKKKP
jgi:hypothetical protein